MGIVKKSKINRLLIGWAEGVVHTTSWLHAQAYSDQNLQKYRSSRWIESIGVGAYKKYGDGVDWAGGLQALQSELHLPVHVGGKSALSLLGKSHYLPLGAQRVQIFGPKAQLLPMWFKNGAWKEEIEYRQKTLFIQTKESFGEKNAGFTTKAEGNISYILSAAERAYLEYLDDMPERASYDEAYKLLEGLSSLRSGVVQSLLEACTSVKVKRLFFHFSDLVNHPWLKKLSKSRIDLGKGKRVVFKNGTLDPKYLITVPKDQV